MWCAYSTNGWMSTGTSIDFMRRVPVEHSLSFIRSASAAPLDSRGLARPVGRPQDLRRDDALQRLGCVDKRWMRNVQRFDTNNLGPQPASKDSPGGAVMRPPRHRLPSAIPAVWVCLRPDPVAPRLGDREIANHDRRWPQPQPHQLSGVIEVEHAQIIGQLVDADCPTGAGNLRKLEHRGIPAGKVSEGLTTCRRTESRQVPHVVVGVVYSAAPLRPMLIQRMARLTRPRGRQVWEHAVSEQSDCPAPSFGVEDFERRRRP